MEPVDPGVKPTSTDTPAPTAAAKPSLMERFKTLLVEYGPLAFIIHFTLFGLTVGGFFIAIQLGFQVESSGGTAGALAAAYGAAQLTKPLRLAALLALTPAVARIPAVARRLERFRQNA